MTDRVRGRGERPTVTPKMYYATNPDGVRQKNPVRLNNTNKERHERLGWTFEAVYR